MRCGSCGASLPPDMVDAGACGYCGTALPRAPEPAKQVHVTQIEVRPPDVNMGGCFDSITARLAGCFSGCASIGITLLILGFSFGVTAWQMWRADAIEHPGAGAPAAEHPKQAPDPAPAGDKKPHRRPKRGH